MTWKARITTGRKARIANPRQRYELLAFTSPAQPILRQGGKFFPLISLINAEKSGRDNFR